MKIHLEFEGSEAHHFVEEYEGFIDDVATRRVERRDPGNCKLRAIITGWPATTYCTTDCKVLEELSTRSLLATPEITEEKISQVLTYKGVKYSQALGGDGRGMILLFARNVRKISGNKFNKKFP